MFDNDDPLPKNYTINVTNVTEFVVQKKKKNHGRPLLNARYIGGMMRLINECSEDETPNCEFLSVFVSSTGTPVMYQEFVCVYVTETVLAGQEFLIRYTN